uniref:Protein kinase domain-containing protein n=2 Tax=Odontella aurita TaxID=265563 RepID=A0A7S4ITG5_9STRA|mmetsp:Transcript_29956/g.89105  ORF Transcript_29956/g.89105 Transcript_29956/m.89105 type:complete len:1266 (+) Transcript_29956:266-4063(+)
MLCLANIPENEAVTATTTQAAGKSDKQQQDFQPFKMQANSGASTPQPLVPSKMVTAAQQSDIDRRMELLEARFVSPAPIGAKGGSAPQSPAFPGQLPSLSNTPSPGGGGGQNSNLQNVLLQAHSSGSHHSFSFEKSAAEQQVEVGVAAFGGNSSRHSAHSHASLASQHSQPQGPPLIQTQSYKAANAAVERHMARVGAALNIPPPPHAGNSPGGEHSRSSSCSASSLGSKSASGTATQRLATTPSANSSLAIAATSRRPASSIHVEKKSAPCDRPGAHILDDSDGFYGRNPQKTSGTHHDSSAAAGTKNLSADNTAASIATSNSNSNRGAPEYCSHRNNAHRRRRRTNANNPNAAASDSVSTSTTVTGTTTGSGTTPSSVPRAQITGAMTSQDVPPPPPRLGAASSSSHLSASVAPPSCSSSNQTLLTGHLHRRPVVRAGGSKGATFVAESPPIVDGDVEGGEHVVGAAGVGAVKSLRLPTNRDAPPSNGGGGSRKKAVPHKRPLSDITLSDPSHNQGKNGGSTPNGRGRSPPAASGGARERSKSPASERRASRKRTRLQFNTAAASAGGDNDQQQQQPQQSQPQPAAAAAVAPSDESADPTSLSRDRAGSTSNPGAASGASTPKSSSKRGGGGGGGGPPSNNKSIHDFFGFGSAKKKKAQSSQPTGAGCGGGEAQQPSRSRVVDGGATDGGGGALSASRAIAADGGQLRPVSPSNLTGGAHDSSSSGAAGSASKAELDRLRRQVADLERLAADRDEQLRAVRNNQSMMQHTLRATLQRRESELETLRSKTESRDARAKAKIEVLIRSESGREAREVRQKLASDGARLGRIVYTRAGLHTVESWEDGQASRALKRRRAELKERRVELERRQRDARVAAQRVARGGDGDAPMKDAVDEAEKDSEGSSDTAGAIGNVIDQLDAMEAEESVRFHLANLRRDEEELAEDERALHHEKGAHIRDLKRVASEDQSRFKSRPTMHERYIPLSQLGKGGFSEVWKAFDLDELREVAVKIHQLDPRWSESKKTNYTKHVTREYDIHRSVRHPRIVSLYDVFEIDDNSFATVLECCEGTDLDTLLKERKTLPERDARAILIQILSGMRYLSAPSEDGSRQGVIHYDLKPGNILFDKYGDAKITDFGLSKIVDTADPTDSMELTSQGAGTYWYLPPECFVTHQSVRISNKVDVWSIGVIYFQMLFGRRPFGDGQSQDKVLSNNIMLNARDVRFPSKPAGVSGGAKDFIRKCLTYDQTFRSNVSQLCAHPYLQQKEL